MQGTVKIGWHEWSNGWLDTQQKRSDSETIESCPCECSGRCWLGN